MPSYKEHSKADWTQPRADEYPGDMAVAIGCLQRIADVLEAIHEQLKPDYREKYEAKTAEERAKQDRYGRWVKVMPLWDASKVSAFRVIEGKINTLSEFAAGRLARLHVRRIYPSWITQDAGLPVEIYDDPAPPPPDCKERYDRFAAEFDPLTFDWSGAYLTPLQRQRLEEAISNARQARAEANGNAEGRT